MIRIIVRTQCCNEVAGMVPDARATFSFKTFDISAPELERYINSNSGDYTTSEFIGVELVQHLPQANAEASDE